MTETNKAVEHRGCQIVKEGDSGGWDWMVYDRDGNRVTAALTLRKAKNAVNLMYPNEN